MNGAHTVDVDSCNAHILVEIVDADIPILVKIDLAVFAGQNINRRDFMAAIVRIRNPEFADEPVLRVVYAPQRNSMRQIARIIYTSHFLVFTLLTGAVTFILAIWFVRCYICS